MVSRISSSSGSLPMTSATRRSAGSGNSITRDQPGRSVTWSSYPIDREHPLSNLGDVAGFDRVDAPSTGPGSRQGENSAPGAYVEHHIVGTDCRRQGGEVVTGPTLVVEHASVFHGIGPSARRGSLSVGRNQCVLLDEHVEDAQNRREVGRMGLFTLQPVNGVAKSYWLREQGQDAEAPRADVDDGSHRRVDDDVARMVASSADPRCELKDRIG